MVDRFWRVLARRTAVAMLAWSGITAAQAASFDLNLTGNLAAGQTFSQDVLGNRYDQYFLALGGLPDGGVAVAQGDTITANVTLDGPFTIPGGASSTTFLIYLQNNSPPNGQFPDVDTETNGTATFLLAGNPVLAEALSVNGRTRGQLAAGRGWTPDTIQALTFDQVLLNLTVTGLPTPAVINLAQISYSLVTPLPAVPETAEWALLAAGLVLVGMARRRRDSAAAPQPA